MKPSICHKQIGKGDNPKYFWIKTASVCYCYCYISLLAVCQITCSLVSGAIGWDAQNKNPNNWLLSLRPWKYNEPPLQCCIFGTQTEDRVFQLDHFSRGGAMIFLGKHMNMFPVQNGFKWRWYFQSCSNLIRSMGLVYLPTNFTTNKSTQKNVGKHMQSFHGNLSWVYMNIRGSSSSSFLPSRQRV